MSERVRTRFAPSPTGYLHLGHAYSAILAYNFAKEHDGEFILRIEDIDPSRCDQKYVEAIYEDLQWLGLEWPTPVRIQSEHYDYYQTHLDHLRDKGLLYPCICSRKDIIEEIKRSGYAPHEDEAVLLYPGICKNTEVDTDNNSYALRLNLEKALQHLENEQLFWTEILEDQDQKMPAKPENFGDIILARKDIPTTYHLSVVLDDALQDITHIIRGVDLASSTHTHRLLQELFGISTPYYMHHKLLCDPQGNRYAKRDKSKTLKSLRSEGKKPEDIYDIIGLRLSV